MQNNNCPRKERLPSNPQSQLPQNFQVRDTERTTAIQLLLEGTTVIQSNFLPIVIRTPDLLTDLRTNDGLLSNHCPPKQNTPRSIVPPPCPMPPTILDRANNHFTTGKRLLSQTPDPYKRQKLIANSCSHASRITDKVTRRISPHTFCS